tara:strand:- start:6488 stop:7633 length:1146 start_codon:yes stop_codon:yes gene_type:complete
MASTFKNLTDNDVVSTKTLLHEAIPITGTIVSGTYNDENIKTFAHGQFQAVYDYPYLSSSANHIFDISVGYSAKSSVSGAASTQNAKKINMYTQMAQVLAGHDATGSILQFDADGNIAAGGQKLETCIFLNFARLITKDEIKKGTFNLIMGMNSGNYGSTDPFDEASLVQIYDANAQNDFRVNSPAGEYAVLYMKDYFSTGFAVAGVPPAKGFPCGLLYYQAGVAVLTASIFDQRNAEAAVGTFGQGFLSKSIAIVPGMTPATVPSQTSSRDVLTGSTMDAFANGFRHRIFNLQFNNTTELNSTVYFCRLAHNEFNYSSNLTYLSSSKLRVKQNSSDAPVAYVTTVGLYSVDNELLATAKVSEPLKKDPTNELTLRVRLDY